MDGNSIKINSNREDLPSTRRTHRAPSKDFRKVLERQERQGREGEEETQMVKKEKGGIQEASLEIAEQPTETEGSKNGKCKVSLFDLVSTEGVEKVEDLTSETDIDIPPEVKKQSLSALFEGYSSPKKLASIQQEAHVPKEKTPSEMFVAEQGNLTQVNPLANSAPLGTEKTVTTQAASPIQAYTTPETQALMEQLLSKIYLMQTQGKMETHLILKHPPLFAGAKVILSSFESAKGEFNITIENLTQAAKNVIETRQNLEAMTQALNQKGFTVHIVTATTLSESLEIADHRVDDEKKEEQKHSSNEKDRHKKQQ